MDAIAISRLNWLTAFNIWDRYCETDDKHAGALSRDAHKSIPTDATIVCSNGTVGAFAAALIARSDVFRVMLSGNFAESISNIALPTDSVEDVKDMVLYIGYRFLPKYLSKFKIKYIDRADRLLDLARRFNLKELEFETYIYRIKNIYYSIDDYFKTYPKFKLDAFPGSITRELQYDYPSFDDDNVLCIIKKKLETRYSCKIILILEPVSTTDNDCNHMLNYVADGVEIYSCKIKKDYVNKCRNIITRIMLKCA